MMKKLVCLILAMLIALPVFPAFAANVSTLTVENASNVNITVPLSLALTVGAGFEDAEVYIDDTMVDAFASTGAASYARSIDLSGMTYLGDATVKVVANYASGTETLTEPIVMSKMQGEATEVFPMETLDTFDGTASTMPYTTSANTNGKYKLYEEGTNKALEIQMQSTSSFYIQKANLGLNKGAIFTLDFDMKFENNDENPPANEIPKARFLLELRDYGPNSSGYPFNGDKTKSSITMVGKNDQQGIFCSGEEGCANTQLYTKQWYNVRVVMNTIGKGVQIYLKKQGETEWVLQADFPNYGLVGLKSFRFSNYGLDGNDSIIYDNIKLTQQREDSVWYAKTGYAYEGEPVSELPISGGQIEVKFSKDMGQIADGAITFTNKNGEAIPFTGSYNAETFIYTITPTAVLRSNSEYRLQIASGILAADYSPALSEQPMTVVTEKHPVYVISATANAGVVEVEVDDSSAEGEVMLVCRYDGGKLVAANAVDLSEGAGEYTVVMENTLTELETRIFILNGFSTMTVVDTYIIGGDSAVGNTALIYPPDTHPRVFLNNETIAYLQENKASEVHAANFNNLLSLANEDLPALPANKALSTSISDQLVARALMHALGETSESHARETVEYALEYFDAPTSSKTSTMDIYEDLGNHGIEPGALIYDWCYDVMIDAERDRLAKSIRDLMYDDRQPFHPDKPEEWTAIAGKEVGDPVRYSSIAAVAIYDRYPEIYDAIMPHIQGDMAEIMRTFGQAGALSDGSISYTREWRSYYVALLFERMGYPDFYGDQSKVGYKMLYSRLPYGGIFKQGDDYLQNGYHIGQYADGTGLSEVLSLVAAMNDDPYLRFQYVKQHYNPKTWENLLLTEKPMELKLPDDLPLAYYIDEPKSEIMARTSWQDGLDSPAVSALLSMHNRRTGDHDHGHIGEFQLYYKGPLTMPGGLYSGTGGAWGGLHWDNYYSRSVSSNCMLVYDPNEKYVRGKKQVEANDGGQLMVAPEDGSNVIGGLEEQMSDSNIWATTEAHYIGPNENTPAFSYIKGDITNAYSKNKMQSYKRGMVFMDTFNETYPGVMVVYDRVVSKDASFKKSWLLQSVTEPVVDANKITIVNTEEGCNGKLVNTTLFPEAVDITKVGEVGKYIVNGKEYPASNDMSDVYKGGIRLEVSPKQENKVDVFVNAMYVTDADGNAPELPMIKEETEQFVGVTTLDRTVLFSKDSRRINEEFTFTVRDNGYEEMLCFITDVEHGKWCIEGENERFVIAADAEGYSLTFSAEPGTYRIYPTTDTATTLTYAEVQKERIGDFSIKLDSTYTYVKSPNKLVNEIPCFAIADLAERYFGAQTVQNGSVLTITTKDGATIKITAGSSRYTYNGSGSSKTVTMGIAAFMENGVMYVDGRKLLGDLGLSQAWIPRAKVFIIRNK